MKKLLALCVALVLAFSFTACGTSMSELEVESETHHALPATESETEPVTYETEPDTEPATSETESEASAATTLSDGRRIGISMPESDAYPWNHDGPYIAQALQDAGYSMELQFAGGDANTQIDQIETMLANGAKLLIIAACDGDALNTVLRQAKEVNTPVVAYVRALSSADAVNGYVTFDYGMIGELQGQYIVDRLDLDHAGDKHFRIEFTGGDQGSTAGSSVYYEGAMSVLQPYLDSGVLICPSGQTELSQIVTDSTDINTVVNRFQELISTYYAKESLDAVLALSDFSAYGAVAALNAYYTGETYPIITGRDCNFSAIKNILAGQQAMSVFLDSRILADRTVEVSKSIMAGTEPEVNSTDAYYFGADPVPAYLCAPEVCTVENCKELLIDTGYFTEEQFAK